MHARIRAIGRGLLVLLVLATGCASAAPCPATSADAPRIERPSDPQPGAVLTLQAILAREGRYAWSDGTSIYTMSSDHTFRLDPVGISGRTIEGTWHFDDGSDSRVVVIGKWGWMNGVSSDRDFRRLEFSVRSTSPRRTAEGLSEPFFVIDELVRISDAEYEAARSAAPAPEAAPR